MIATITNIRKENERIIVFARFEGVETQEKTFVFIPEEANEDTIKSKILEEKNRLVNIEQKADELQSLVNEVI